MSKKILLVDDEQSLLNGLERRLGLEFEIETASSGEEALEKMDSLGPFAVVVTDMQMPQMDGVQFIQHARILAPDTVYLMLTGNQDLQTASKAVNDGEVFRFLNKPCDADRLKRALQAGLRQYELITNEKKLLRNTFVGTINVLSDVLEVSQPDLFSRTPTIEDTFEQLMVKLKVKDSWELRIASRLGVIGFALLTEDEKKVFEQAPVASRESQEVFRQMASLGERLLEKIPRLSLVARIIGSQSDCEGELPGSGNSDRTKLGAVLLRVSVLWSSLRSSGLSTQQSLDELRILLPRLSEDILGALCRLKQAEKESSVEVDCMQLSEGMVVFKDVLTVDDERLLRAGQRLSAAMIEKLQLHQQTCKKLKPISVYESGIAPASHALCS